MWFHLEYVKYELHQKLLKTRVGNSIDQQLKANSTLTAAPPYFLNLIDARTNFTPFQGSTSDIAAHTLTHVTHPYASNQRNVIPTILFLLLVSAEALTNKYTWKIELERVSGRRYLFGIVADRIRAQRSSTLLPSGKFKLILKIQSKYACYLNGDSVSLE